MQPYATRGKNLQEPKNVSVFQSSEKGGLRTSGTAILSVRQRNGRELGCGGWGGGRIWERGRNYESVCVGCTVQGCMGSSIYPQNKKTIMDYNILLKYI